MWIYGYITHRVERLNLFEHRFLIETYVHRFIGGVNRCLLFPMLADQHEMFAMMSHFSAFSSIMAGTHEIIYAPGQARTTASTIITTQL